MKQWLRYVALMLSLVSVLGFAVSCRKTGDNGVETSPGNSSVDETRNFPVEKFGSEGRPEEYVIASRTERSDFLWVAEPDATIMHPATYRRNAEINELFNVNITLAELGHSEGTEFKAKLEVESLSQAGAYDLICPTWWWATEQNGYYVNLLNLQGEIDLGDPWWYDSWNQNVTFAGYMASIMGDAAFDTYYNMEVVFFNKGLAASLELDPYSYVDNKTWTLEVANEYGRKIARDVNGDGYSIDSSSHSLTGGDVIGNLLNESNIHSALFSLGAKYSDNNDGEITLRLKEEHNYDVFRKLFSFINEEEQNLIAATTTLGLDAITPFTSNQVLFLWQAFRVGATLRQGEVKYGILPCPMYDEAQGDYITAIYDASNFSIMQTAKNKHMSALVLNALNAVTDAHMTVPYFEQELGVRVADDPDSSRMIPLIRNSLYCDFTWINIDSMQWCCEKFPAYIRRNDPNVANVIDREYGLYTDALTKMRERMVEFRDREL